MDYDILNIGVVTQFNQQFKILKPQAYLFLNIF